MKYDLYTRPYIAGEAWRRWPETVEAGSAKEAAATVGGPAGQTGDPEIFLCNGEVEIKVIPVLDDSEPEPAPVPAKDTPVECRLGCGVLLASGEHGVCKECNSLMATTFEGYQVLTASTGHISESDSTILGLLGSDSTALALTRDEYGFRIYTGPESSQTDNPEAFRALGLSHALRRLLRAASDRGYQYLELDADAQIYPGIEIFDW